MGSARVDDWGVLGELESAQAARLVDSQLVAAEV